MALSYSQGRVRPYLCTVEGCDRPGCARGFCGLHYERYRSTGDPLLKRPPHRPRPRVNVGLCPVEGCETKAKVGGYCNKHYHRLKRHGDPLIQRRATSTPGVDRAYKAAYVEQYKLEHGCADCGYVEHPAALDFDHRPGTIKVRDIKSGQQLGWEALLAEIEKCDVVCANCHRIRTFNRGREVRSK